MKFNPSSSQIEVSNNCGIAEEGINRFLQTISLRGLSKYTVRSYGYDLIVVHRWLKKAGLTFDNIQGKNLFDFIEHEKARGQSSKSINRCLVTLRVYYRFLFDRDVETGPGMSESGGHYRGAGSHAMGLVVRRRRGRLRLKVKEDELLIIPLKIEEVNEFIKGMTSYRDLAMVGLMLFCGLRSCEVRKIEINKVNFEERNLVVLGKGRRERMVPLTDQVIQIIKSYLSIERPKKSTSKNLFLVAKGPTRGSPITADGIRSLFRYRRKKSGVSNANPHRFRHTFGTNMAKARVNLRILQMLLGHADGSPVTQRYLHISMTDVADAFFGVCHEIQEKYHGLK